MPGRIVRGNCGAGQDEWTLARVDRSTHVVPKLGHLLSLVEEARLLTSEDERRINLGSCSRLLIDIEQDSALRTMARGLRLSHTLGTVEHDSAGSTQRRVQLGVYHPG